MRPKRAVRIAGRQIDLLAGLGALFWSVSALEYHELERIVSIEAASAFGIFAMGRWYVRAKSGANTVAPEEASDV